MAGELGKLIVLREQVDELTRRMAPLEDAVGNVTSLLEDLQKARAQAKPTPVWWPNLGDDERADRDREFTRWLRDVLAAHYPDDARKLTKCWRDHPAIVDLLTAAWLTWQAAYLNPAADPAVAAQWQTMWRPQLFGMVAADQGPVVCRRKDAHVPAEPLSADLLGSFR